MNGKWYINKGEHGDVVISTRIRLARNIAKYPFPVRLDAEGSSPAAWREATGTARLGLEGFVAWVDAAFEAATGRLYLKVTNLGQIARIEKRDPNAPTPRPGEVDADYVNRALQGWFMDGLPLTKPPYARLVAIDLNRGTIAWQRPFGDHPAVREQLETLGVKVTEPLGALGPPGLLATASGLLFVGGGDRAFHAVDAATGRELWSTPTLETTGTPMTYAAADEATRVAFALP